MYTEQKHKELGPDMGYAMEVMGIMYFIYAEKYQHILPFHTGLTVMTRMSLQFVEDTKDELEFADGLEDRAFMYFLDNMPRFLAYCIGKVMYCGRVGTVELEPGMRVDIDRTVAQLTMAIEEIQEA